VSRYVFLSLCLPILLMMDTVIALDNQVSPARHGLAGERAAMLSKVGATTIPEEQQANHVQDAAHYAPVNCGESVDPPELHAGASSLPGDWVVYADPSFGFRIGIPNRFVVSPQKMAELAESAPAPVAAIFFMNPTMAAGDLAGIEPPDLELRIYFLNSADSLEDWLIAVGFASVDSGASTRPYRNTIISGLKVCQSTMISPGCSVYLLHREHVYQLTAISAEGERMIETFLP
jgi:hypothetical protein